MVKPITPDQVGAAKAAILPDHVIETWNELIAANWSGGRACVQQNDAVVALMDHVDSSVIDLASRRQEVFNLKWLDIEDVYCEQGWDVEYDKPGYNEDYEATFTFEPKRS